MTKSFAHANSILLIFLLKILLYFIIIYQGIDDFHPASLRRWPRHVIEKLLYLNFDLRPFWHQIDHST